MSRLARIVAPGFPHHITQRGNRRAQIFFCDDDYQRYLDRLKKDAANRGLAILAYCLMSNHVHHVAIPEGLLSLAETLRDTHTFYATYRNRCDDCSGHLWQGRYFSSVLDGSHLWAAVRYVERNPVRAGLVEHASDYKWSSAAAHCGLRQDPLLTIPPIFQEFVDEWPSWLSVEDANHTKTFRKATHTGRPAGSSEFIAQLEATLGRKVFPNKRGPSPKIQTYDI